MRHTRKVLSFYVCVSNCSLSLPEEALEAAQRLTLHHEQKGDEGKWQ